jgi:hypothetical protein
LKIVSSQTSSMELDWFFILELLGFELRVLYLLARCSTTWAMATTFHCTLVMGKRPDWVEIQGTILFHLTFFESTFWLKKKICLHWVIKPVLGPEEGGSWV